MEVLFGYGRPFKIGYMIISLVTIYVIYRGFVLRIRDKHESNKAMYKELSDNHLFPDTYLWIPILVSWWNEYPFKFVTKYPAVVAYPVSRVIWYDFPLFHAY